MHSQRIKELESEFEKRQALRQKDLQHKLETSQQLKYKSINSLQQRLKKISERRNKVGEQLREREREETKKQL